MNGFQIHARTRAVAPDLAERFRRIPVANISDCMSRMTAGGPRLRPMHGGAVMAGPALTVRTRPGDNLLVHKALDLAQPGDVIVVDAGGDLTNAIIGEIMTSYARSRGVAGIVINGAIRDCGAIRQGDFPVYAAGVTHRGPYKDGPGEINGTIALDGMTIAPGDLILGDDDGVLAIPFDQVETLYQAAQAKHEIEERMLADIAAGTLDTSWIDARLRQLGCAGSDDDSTRTARVHGRAAGLVDRSRLRRGHPGRRRAAPVRAGGRRRGRAHGRGPGAGAGLSRQRRQG